MSYQNYLGSIPKQNSIQNDIYDKKILLLFDLEGVIGVLNLANMEENRKLAYRELSLVINYLKDAKFHNITVCNIHDNGNCLSSDVLKSMGVDLIKGIQNLPFHIESFKFAIMLGFHGKRNSGGRFDHTFRTDILKMYYGRKSIGEVGAYYMWLMSKGVMVSMISGEGNFKDEIENEDCVIHTIKPMLSNPDEISNEYIHLKQKLTCAIEIMLYKKLYLRDNLSNRILITVDNPDKYIIVGEKKKIHLNKDGKSFEFLSIDDFFENLYTFAMELNKANKKIYENNIQFINRLKKIGYSKLELSRLLKEYLKKDILQINSEDRKNIAKKMEIYYEDFIFNK